MKGHNHSKTRSKVSEMGKLVTRAQLQSAANQIGAALGSAMTQVQASNEDRMADIELRLRLLEVGAGYDFLYDGDTGRRVQRPELVEEENGTAEITDAGREALVQDGAA